MATQNSVKENEEVVTAAKEKKAAEKVSTKKFKSDDLIPCKSITNGELLMVGAKSGMLYKWADFDDVEYVEYQDLIYETRSTGNSYVMYPRFIIMDEDYVMQNKKLDEVYSKLYTIKDIRSILDMPPARMRQTIEGLPKGAQEAVKGLAATMIANGSYDSIGKIKVLDEIFETNLLLTLVEK